MLSGDVSKWDVSHITGMNGRFMYLAAFDGDISNWDVSRVIDIDDRSTPGQCSVATFRSGTYLTSPV